MYQKKNSFIFEYFRRRIFSLRRKGWHGWKRRREERKGRGGEGMMDREVLRVETYQRNQTLPCDLIIHFS